MLNLVSKVPRPDHWLAVKSITVPASACVTVPMLLAILFSESRLRAMLSVVSLIVTRVRELTAMAAKAVAMLTGPVEAAWV